MGSRGFRAVIATVKSRLYTTSVSRMSGRRTGLRLLYLQVLGSHSQCGRVQWRRVAVVHTPSAALHDPAAAVEELRSGMTRMLNQCMQHLVPNDLSMERLEAAQHDSGRRPDQYPLTTFPSRTTGAPLDVAYHDTASSGRVMPEHSSTISHQRAYTGGGE